MSDFFVQVDLCGIEAYVAWETFKVWGVIDSLDSFSGHVVGHFVELFG